MDLFFLSGQKVPCVAFGLKLEIKFLIVWALLFSFATWDKRSFGESRIL
jgi:hypothetical protein